MSSQSGDDKASQKGDPATTDPRAGFGNRNTSAEASNWFISASAAQLFGFVPPCEVVARQKGPLIWYCDQQRSPTALLHTNSYNEVNRQLRPGEIIWDPALPQVRRDAILFGFVHAVGNENHQVPIWSRGVAAKRGNLEEEDEAVGGLDHRRGGRREHGNEKKDVMQPNTSDDRTDHRIPHQVSTLNPTAPIFEPRAARE